MNWISKFNSLSKEIENFIVDESILRMESIEEGCNKAYDNLLRIYNLVIKNLNDDIETDFKRECDNTLEMIADIQIECLEYCDYVIDLFDQKFQYLHLTVMQYLNNNKDNILYIKRLNLWKKKMHNTITGILQYTTTCIFKDFCINVENILLSTDQYFELFLENSDIEQILENIVPYKEEYEQTFEEEIENKITNIYDWKKMEGLAKENNYEYKYANGSHRIYEHKTSKKIIVIPAHELGKGLSIQIQKQIYHNSY